MARTKARTPGSSASPPPADSSALAPPSSPAGEAPDKVNVYHLPSLKTAFDQSLISVRNVLSVLRSSRGLGLLTCGCLVSSCAS